MMHVQKENHRNLMHSVKSGHFLLMVLCALLFCVVLSCSRAQKEQVVDQGIVIEQDEANTEIEPPPPNTNKPKKYVVEFNSMDGPYVPFQVIDSNSTVAEPSSPERVGLSFGGWYSDIYLNDIYDFSAPVSKELTLYAKWVLTSNLSFIVTFESNEGTEVISQTVFTNTTPTAIKPPAPTRRNYVFVNWFTDDETFEQVFDFSEPVVENTTLYAKWAIKGTPLFTLSFHSNEGSEVAEILTDSNSIVRPPRNPTRDGYRFDGWFEDNETFAIPYTFNDPVRYSATLYAKWVQAFTIYFNTNGGSIIPVQYIDKDRSSTTIVPNTPERPGYFFGDWFADPDLREVYDFNTPITKDITLYAGWEYVVEYDLHTQTVLGLNPAIKENIDLVILGEIEGVTMRRIANGAFSRKRHITSLRLPNTIQVIGDGAFSECDRISGELIIPNSVTHIGIGAFAALRGIKGNVVIPSSVESIGNSAFAAMWGVDKFIFQGIVPPRFGVDIFAFFGSVLNIQVSEQALDNYLEAPNFSLYQDKITTY